MGIDPAIFQNVAQNMRAEALPRQRNIKLDPASIEKIGQNP